MHVIVDIVVVLVDDEDDAEDTAEDDESLSLPSYLRPLSIVMVIIVNGSLAYELLCQLRGKVEGGGG